MSPGWQFKALHISSRVEKRIAFALLFFIIERLASVIPTFSDNSPRDIFRFANITSRLTTIIKNPPLCQIVRSFSSLISTARSIIFLTTRSINPTSPAANPRSKQVQYTEPKVKNSKPAIIHNHEQARK